MNAIASLCLALAIGGVFAAEKLPQRAAERLPQRTPQGMPDPGIFAPFIEGNSGCLSMKLVVGAGARIMPLKEETFRFLEGIYVVIPPPSPELPLGNKAVLAIGPHGEVMAVIVDGEQTCARFIPPNYVIEMIAAIESGNAPSKSGNNL